jgi:hypothetical protein
VLLGEAGQYVWLVSRTTSSLLVAAPWYSQMLEGKAEQVFAFLGEKGTGSLVRKARQAGMEVLLVQTR